MISIMKPERLGRAVLRCLCRSVPEPVCRGGSAGMVVLFLGLSVVVHLMIMQGIYRYAHGRSSLPVVQAAAMKQPEAPAAVPLAIRAVSPPAVKQPETRPQKPQAEKKVARKAQAEKTLTQQRPADVQGSRQSGVKPGSCPSITIEYDDPVSYIRTMYSLGAITLITDASFGSVYRIDLLQESLQTLDKKDIKQFSAFKRVVNDAVWLQQKTRFAARLHAAPEDLEVLLLIPEAVESHWVEHIMAIGRSQDIRGEDIQSVVCRFEDSLTVRLLVCKNGTTVEVRDTHGA